MKKEFQDKSFIECYKNEQGKIFVVIQASDSSNSLKKITNTVELTVEEFKKLISGVI